MIISYVQLGSNNSYIYQMPYVQSLENDGIFLNILMHLKMYNASLLRNTNVLLKCC